MWIFIIVVAIGVAGILIAMATSRTKKKRPFSLKAEHKIETLWAIGIAAVLVWLWIISYPWMPPVAFSAVNPNKEDVQVVDVQAGQWFWIMHRTGQPPPKAGDSPQVTVEAGKPVKFVAHSQDVNHGFGIFSSKDDSPILAQMQVVPGVDNVMYYTFKHPGTYLIRCLEYCGFAHPYMTSQITVVAAGPHAGTVEGSSSSVSAAIVVAAVGESMTSQGNET